MIISIKTKLQNMFSVAHFEYEKKLSTHAFLKLHDRELSEDLVQETFTKTWIYLVKGGKIDTMRAFLYHVLNDLIVDEYRKHKTSSLDILLQKGFEPEDDNPEHLFEKMDGKAAMLLIQRLPTACQRVMRMRYIQELSLTEMSLIIGQTKNTIAVQLHRGLVKLRALYKPIPTSQL